MERRAQKLGARIRLARIRRAIPLTEMAVRVGASRTTLLRLEQGSLQVSLAVLARVLEVLRLDADLDGIAGTDEVGERLSDARLKRPRRGSKPTLADEL